MVIDKEPEKQAENTNPDDATLKDAANPTTVKPENPPKSLLHKLGHAFYIILIIMFLGVAIKIGWSLM
ncbi:MAG: hypothetical protein V3R66_07410 [Rhodospirillales bacterium]